MPPSYSVIEKKKNKKETRKKIQALVVSQFKGLTLDFLQQMDRLQIDGSRGLGAKSGQGDDNT